MSILGDIGGFFFGNGNKGKSHTKQTQNTTTTTAPYAPAVPAVSDFLKNAGTLFNGGAPQISPLEQTGYDSLAKVASAPSAQSTDAMAQNDATINGKYLTPETNPYLADIARRIGGTTMQAVNATYGGAGRTGSGLALNSAGQGVGDALSSFFGGEYDKERALQQNAIGQAPSLEASRYLGPTSEISAGQQISARPFDIANQYAGILSNIARLGGTTNASGTNISNGTTQAANNGWLTNKLFPTG